MSTVDAPPVLHPLEPLTAVEVGLASSILKAEKGLAATARFVFISLHEPEKAAVQAGEPVSREAFVVLYETAERKTYEAVVSLTERSGGLVRAHRGRAAADHRRGVRPRGGARAERSALAGGHAPPRRRRLRQRHDRQVVVGLHRAGATIPEARRLARLLTFVRIRARRQRLRPPGRGPHRDRRPGHLGGARGRRPRRRRRCRRRTGNFEEGLLVAGQRSTLRRRSARADEADRDHAARGPELRPSTGHRCRWQKWRLRVGFTPREGLVLHDVRYEDGERLRPILYRALGLPRCSCPTATRRRPTATRTSSTWASTASACWPTRWTLGCDCLGEIHYFDARGQRPGRRSRSTIPNAICMHEEDDGIALEAHRLPRPARSRCAAARRLVISFIVTVGNYEYGFYWYLYQDGSIEFEVKLTGIISTGAVRPGRGRRQHGTACVAPRLYGPAPPALLLRAARHVDVDGGGNSVVRGQHRAAADGARTTRTATPG